MTQSHFLLAQRSGIARRQCWYVKLSHSSPFRLAPLVHADRNINLIRLPSSFSALHFSVPPATSLRRRWLPFWNDILLSQIPCATRYDVRSCDTHTRLQMTSVWNAHAHHHLDDRLLAELANAPCQRTQMSPSKRWNTGAPTREGWRKYARRIFYVVVAIALLYIGRRLHELQLIERERQSADAAAKLHASQLAVRTAAAGTSPSWPSTSCSLYEACRSGISCSASASRDGYTPSLRTRRGRGGWRGSSMLRRCPSVRHFVLCSCPSDQLATGARKLRCAQSFRGKRRAKPPRWDR